MRKIANILIRFQYNKKFTIVSILLLAIASFVFPVPYINTFNFTELSTTILAICILGLAIFLATLLLLFVFCKIQKSIKNLHLIEAISKLALVFAIEMLLYTALTFVLMFLPSLYIALSVIITCCLCGINVFLMYYCFEHQTQEKETLFKTCKLFNVIPLAIIICLWLII